MFDAQIRWSGPLELDRNGELAAALEVLTTSEEPLQVHVDLSSLTFATPTGLAMLRCALQAGREAGVIAPGSAFRPPNDASVWSYVQRMNAVTGVLPGHDAP